jgi:tripartite ATP-independent transporter DctP family solute receptor
MTRIAYPLRQLPDQASNTISRRNALKGAALGAAAITSGVFSIGRAKADTITMRIGSDSPIGAPHTLSAVRLKDGVEKLTDGRIKVEIFPNSQLGDSEAMSTSVKSGTLDAVMSSAANLANAVPSADVFNLPFLFKDTLQVMRAANGELGAKLKPRVEASFNCEVVGWANDGSRNMWNGKRPIRKPEDLQGLKMRGVSSSRIMRDTFLAFGAIPTPLAYSETYTGLQTGVIDGADFGVVDMLELKLYQVTKYLTLTHQISPAGIFIVSKKFLNRLSPADQQLVRDSARIGADEQVKTVLAKETSALEELKARGMQVFEMEDRNAFVAKAQPVLAEATARVGADMMELARAAAAS